MAPRTPLQYEKIRKQKTDLIKQAALNLFAEKGYPATSIAMIAKKAKISKGLIYNYFNSKEELLKAILFEELNSIYQSLDPNQDGVLEPVELKNFIIKQLEALDTKREFFKFYFRVSMQPEVFPILEEKMKEMMTPMMHMMVNYFAQQGSDDPESEALLFGALMDGLSMDYVFSPDLIPIERIKNILIKKYCNL